MLFFGIALPSEFEKRSDTDLEQDMLPLETEEEAEERQKRQELIILTSKQMITKLPILLAELNCMKTIQKN